MKKFSRGFVVVLALTAMFLSACGAAASPNSNGSVDPVSGGKGNASLVNFTGMVEAINGENDG